MNGQVAVIEAVEWRERAPGGGSEAQVFRLADGQFAIVKFPENNQGELVLANEFLCCRLAEYFNLPINRAVIVSVDERLLRLPRQNGQVPTTFSAGLRCGMIRFEKAEGAELAQILDTCSNSAELHHVIAFEQLVNRQDGRQLLTYIPENESKKRFAAYDYGFAFGGNATWTATGLTGVADAMLPANDPFTGTAYTDGSHLAAFIEKLRTMTRQHIEHCLNQLNPPRWGATVDDISALAKFLEDRALSLVRQFDQRYRPDHLEGI
jgi:hypothetical protein